MTSQNLMRVVTVRSANRIELGEAPMPAIGPGQALVRVSSCAICGSDVKLIRGEMEDISYPLIPGHEWSGVVAEAPTEFRGLVGKRVVSDILQNCKHCESCLRSLPNLCANLVEPGFSAPGAFASHIIVPCERVHILPDTITAEQACMIEPLAVVLYALKRIPISSADRVLILGGGGIGQLLLRVVLLKHPGFAAISDHHQHRLEAARLAGAHLVINGQESDLTSEPLLSGGQAPTVVFDAAGNASAFETALQVICPGGRIGVLGYDGVRKTKIAPSLIMRKLLDIRGILSPTGTWPQAIRLMASGKVIVDDLLTHKLPLSEFATGWKLAATRGDKAIRVVIQP